MLTLVPATHWGFADRGLVREGFAADLIVFDPDTISPELPEVVNDLPAGARRLVQRARGIAATIVNGEVLLRDRSEEHTSELQSQSNLVCRLLLEKKTHKHRSLARPTRSNPHDRPLPTLRQILPVFLGMISRARPPVISALTMPMYSLSVA